MIRGGEEVMYHGPRLAKWLDGKGVMAGDMPESLARAVRRWRSGERASERLVDRLCTHLGWGSHLTTVPHEFIVKGRKLVDPDYRGRKAA